MAPGYTYLLLTGPCSGCGLSCAGGEFLLWDYHNFAKQTAFRVAAFLHKQVEMTYESNGNDKRQQ